jgi:acetyl-CoA acetyltransferase
LENPWEILAIEKISQAAVKIFDLNQIPAPLRSARRLSAKLPSGDLLSEDIVNVEGGAFAHGHSIGATFAGSQFPAALVCRGAVRCFSIG